jgi:tryptophanyl-tRNA synthetase
VLVTDHLAGGIGYGYFKKRLWEAYWDFFAPMRERRAELLDDPGYVEKVLADGAVKAREEAERVLGRVRNAVGLR